MAEAAAQLRASADKVRERAREVRFGPMDDKEPSAIVRLMGRLNRKDASGRSSPPDRARSR